MITSRQRDHVLLLVLSAAIITIGMSISNIDAQKSDFKKYENTDYNVKIDYPSKWKKSENNLAQNQIVIFSAPEVEEKESSLSTIIFIPARLALASQQTPSSNMTLEDFTNYFIDSGYSSPDQYKIISTSKTTLAGNEAVELLMYEYVNDQTSKVKRVISLFDNDTAYMIKYAAEPGKFSKYLPIAQQMIDSFQPTTFLKNNITTVDETTEEKKIPIEIPTTVPKSKKSYQLIIYLDNASPQNVIGDNFDILVYNSNNEPVLSAKPNIDFNDDHQKISPPKGYPIIYQSGQYPKDIRVCAQQEYQLNGTTYLHNDCYPIIQNVQKTYWYTTFDYGEIDGFEANSNPIVKSNEMAPATTTITPEDKAESNSQIVTIVQGSADAGSGENKYDAEKHAGYGFDPRELTIEKGTIVKWINNDTTIHTVTSGKPSSNTVGTAFDSSYLNEGEPYLHKFNKKGTYDYYCTMYPFMKGKIIVK
jgi:plastocyanin